MTLRGFDPRELPDLNRRLEVYVGSLPAGVNPMTHGADEVRRRFSQIALFPMLSMSDERIPNRPIIENDQLIGVEIHEALHRFVAATRPAMRGGPSVDNVIDEPQVATAQVNWRLAPDAYVARPGQMPPPTPLRPDISQRFSMEGRFFFADAQQSGFHGFAVGRTFPTSASGSPTLRFAAMVEILQGYGAFYGHLGNIGINGIVEPPSIMRLAVMPTLLDFDGHLSTKQPLTSRPNLPDPAPDEVFFILRGDMTRERPMPISPMQGGLLLAQVGLPLRSIGVDFEIEPRLVSHTLDGPVIGTHKTNFWIGPIDGGVLVPFQSVGGAYRLYDRDGEPLGAVDADILEGRAWSFTLPGLGAPCYRFAGIGPINRGTGLFKGAQGFVTMIGVLSLFPRVISIYYIIRLDDPTGRIRETTVKAWRRGDAASTDAGSST